MCLGIPGQITDIDPLDPTYGMVDVSGVKRRVCLTCVLNEVPKDQLVGQWVLVHVGFAMSVLNESEAQATLKALEDLGEAMDEIDAIRNSNEMLGVQG